MTEAEWLTATDPMPMLQFLRGKPSERKLRLFSCGVARAMWAQLRDYRSRAAIELAEEYADGIADEGEREVAHSRAGAVVREMNDRLLMLGATTPDVLADPHFQKAFYAVFAVGPETGDMDQHASIPSLGWVPPHVLTDQLREIVGKPFRPVTVDPAWLTSDVVSLAEGIYQERAFDRLPILADALQDAGCENEDVLNHCRLPGEHVRGCWGIDLLTGRA